MRPWYGTARDELSVLVLQATNAGLEVLGMRIRYTHSTPLGILQVWETSSHQWVASAGRKHRTRRGVECWRGRGYGTVRGSWYQPA